MLTRLMFLVVLLSAGDVVAADLTPDQSAWLDAQFAAMKAPMTYVIYADLNVRARTPAFGLSFDGAQVIAIEFKPEATREQKDAAWAWVREHTLDAWKKDNPGGEAD
jgi:hypothetical protein